MILENKGTGDAIIYSSCINGFALSQYGASHNFTVEGLTIRAGQKGALEISIPTSALSSGTHIEVKLISREGASYPWTVVLP